MTINETKPFGLPQSAYERPVHEALLKACDIDEFADQSTLHLAHIIVTANKIDGRWYAYAIDPYNPPTTPDEAYGSFQEDDAIDARELLSRAEQWIRESGATEWVPGRIIQFPDEDPRAAMGHLLVRASEQ